MIHYIIYGGKDYRASASYNRVRLVCDGLKASGINVKLHLLRLKGNKNRYLNLFARYVYSYIINLIHALSICYSVSKKDVVIFYGEFDFYWIFPLFGEKTNFVVEHNEYPYFMINDKYGVLNRYVSKKNLEYLKYASSVITCSSYLADFYHKYVNEIYIIPLIVSLEEFDKIPRNNQSSFGEYIAYCGNFNNNKDGVPTLIDAFKLFHEKHPQMRLVLIGSGTDNNVNRFKAVIREYGLSDQVVFTGSLPHEEVGKWLVGATMLALARPDNLQAKGGVPSKVGEYLASGVPCVITKTGDLPNYLSDGVDCFLCEPDSAVRFSKRLEDCYMSDRELIGQKGQEAAKQFDYIYQSERLISFLMEQYGRKAMI